MESFLLDITETFVDPTAHPSWESLKNVFQQQILPWWSEQHVVPSIDDILYKFDQVLAFAQEYLQLSSASATTVLEPAPEPRPSSEDFERTPPPPPPPPPSQPVRSDNLELAQLAAVVAATTPNLSVETNVQSYLPLADADASLMSVDPKSPWVCPRPVPIPSPWSLPAATANSTAPSATVPSPLGIPLSQIPLPSYDAPLYIGDVDSESDLPMTPKILFSDRTTSSAAGFYCKVPMTNQAMGRSYHTVLQEQRVKVTLHEEDAAFRPSASSSTW